MFLYILIFKFLALVAWLKFLQFRAARKIETWLLYFGNQILWKAAFFFSIYCPFGAGIIFFNFSTLCI